MFVMTSVTCSLFSSPKQSYVLWKQGQNLSTIHHTGPYLVGAEVHVS